MARTFPGPEQHPDEQHSHPRMLHRPEAPLLCAVMAHQQICAKRLQCCRR